MSTYPRTKLSPFERRTEAFPGKALRSIDPAAVEAEIDRLEREAERAAEEYEARAVDAARAAHAWKLAEAKTVTRVTAQPKGSVSAAERQALVDHEDKYLAYKMSEALLMSIDKRCWMIRDALDAHRTLNANVREQTD